MVRIVVLALAAYVLLAAGTRVASPEELTRPTGEVAWALPRVSADGREVEVQVGTAGPGAPPCRTRYHTAVDETAARVVLAVDDVWQLPLVVTGCAASAVPQRVRVELSRPLGDRELVDAATGGARPASDEAAIARVTHLPADLRRTAVDVIEPGGWGQHFDGPEGRDLQVLQHPAAVAPPPSGDPIGEATIDGATATRTTEGSDAYRAVRWQEGGWVLEVVLGRSADQDQPDDDELLRIAAGVELPTTAGRPDR